MILGLTGKAGSGKDYVANYIVEHDPEMQWNIVKFGDKLKEYAELIVPGYSIEAWETMSHEDREKPRTELGGRSQRQVLQYFGTEFGRWIYEDFWVDRLIDSLSPSHNYIVTDVRFLNEAKAIMENRGRLVRIINPHKTSTATHASETEMDQIEPNFTFFNSRTMERTVWKTYLNIIYQSSVARNLR